MENLIIVQVSTLIAFMAFNGLSQYILSKYGLLNSFSHGKYKLSLRNDNNYLFEVVIILSGCALIMNGLYITDQIQYVMMAGGILIIGVAVFSKFLANKYVLIAHNVCAIGGFVMSVISLGFVNPFYFIISGSILGAAGIYILSKGDSRKKDWNIEQIVVNGLILGVFIVTWVEMLKL